MAAEIISGVLSATEIFKKIGLNLRSGRESSQEQLRAKAEVDLIKAATRYIEERKRFLTLNGRLDESIVQGPIGAKAVKNYFFTASLTPEKNYRFKQISWQTDSSGNPSLGEMTEVILDGELNCVVSIATGNFFDEKLTPIEGIMAQTKFLKDMTACLKH